MTFDTETLDLVISSFGWLFGLSSALVGGSITAYSLWYASSTARPGLSAIFVRSACGFAGTGASALGVVLVSIATEAFLRYPFGPSSGGSAWVGYFVGTQLLTAQYFADWVLLSGHAARTDSWFSRAAAALAGATAAVWFALSRLVGVTMLLVSLSGLLYVIGWLE